MNLKPPFVCSRPNHGVSKIESRSSSFIGVSSGWQVFRWGRRMSFLPGFVRLALMSTSAVHHHIYGLAHPGAVPRDENGIDARATEKAQHLFIPVGCKQVPHHQRDSLGGISQRGCMAQDFPVDISHGNSLENFSDFQALFGANFQGLLRKINFQFEQVFHKANY